MALINSIQNMSLQWRNSPLEPPGVDSAAAATGNSVGAPEKSGNIKGSDSFTDVLNRIVESVDQKMDLAEAAKTSVLAGDATNLHQAMIATQEASVAFSLMVEVRNELVESYQELMRMQV